VHLELWLHKFAAVMALMGNVRARRSRLRCFFGTLE